MKALVKVCTIAIAALTMAAYTAHAQADATTTNTPPAKPKVRGHPYRGTVSAVDSTAKTVTITTAGGESVTLHITSKTRIRKDGEAATLADIANGDSIRGTDRKDDSGDWVASTVNDGVVKKATPPPATTPPADANK